jgi:hypothetical protein
MKLMLILLRSRNYLTVCALGYGEYKPSRENRHADHSLVVGRTFDRSDRAHGGPRDLINLT